MKRLLRRLSCVADSSSSFSSPLLPRPKPPRGRRRRCSYYYVPHADAAPAPVPAGHLPLRVEDPSGGGASRRFVVPAEVLAAPAIAALLRRSAREYGYDQSGVIRIPCPAEVFQRVLDSLLRSSRRHPCGEEEGEEQGGWVWDDEEEDQLDLGWSPPLRHGRAECSCCC